MSRSGFYGKKGILSRNLPHDAFVFESIPRSPMAYFSPALSFAVGPGNGKEIEIDDVSVSAFYASEDKNQLITLFYEDFGQLKEEDGIENYGWRTKSERALEDIQKETVLKCLTIKSCEGEQVTVVKFFNVPVDFPFDTSDNNFEIRYNDSMYTDSAANEVFPRHGGSGVSGGNFYSSSSTTLSNKTPGISRTSELFNTYYIYTFDGKLLAEYDHNGNCVRDYIYFGNRLLAEYKPQTNEYFYYMTDQINSTRIITDANGNVVFSEAYGPYGDVQKTWVNTYDPKLKFSGKEREGYSDLDYFGARYYDHKSYRFNSVDPVITKDEALSNPQLWNLYAYCRNNPITYFDPDGKIEGSATRRILVYNQLYNKWLKEGGREYADQKWELIYQSEFVAGLAGAAGALFLAAPEIIAATGPAIRIAGDKIANFFSRFSQGSSSINYNKLFEALSKNNLRHLIKHLSEFQKYDQNMTLRNLVDLGHKIASNANNLVGTPGGRKVFEAIIEIGGKSLTVRAVLNAAGKLNSIHIR